MESDREIGKIVLVNTYSALVELNLDSRSYVKSSITGTYPIGVLNSYVIIPIGTDRIVAMVTKVQMKEEAQTDFKSQKTLILPISSRTMWVTMVGTITQTDIKKEFKFGITRYPELDNPVWLVTEYELDYIFEKKVFEKDKENRLISIGSSPIFSGYDVNIDMNKFFGKHAAILGNTGSGKSCTVKAIIESVLNKKDSNGMPNANFIIFDTNNEYENAFTKYDGDRNIVEIYYNRLVIRNIGDEPDGFFIPHWFMNGRDFEALLTPAQQTQAPILANSVSRARGAEMSPFQSFLFFRVVINAINRIKDRMTQTQGHVCNDIRKQALGFNHQGIRDQIDILKKGWSEFDENKYLIKFNEIHNNVFPSDDAWRIVQPGEDAQLSEILSDLESYLSEDLRKFSENFNSTGITSIDTPKPFSYQEFRHKHIEDEIQAQEQHDQRVRGFIGSLILRIDRMYRDPRYKFLFSSDTFENSLASFLRYIFGEEPDKNFNDGVPPWKKYYEKQKNKVGANKHKITIIDFSNLASDVLENMTALIGRLILEFMQKIEPRSNYPTALILEEAHHYIPSGTYLTERQQRAREVFERIAKEGRKYGLSLVVASQRPSELSRTVLAQCNSFIVHRIQNPDDKEYFKSVMPSVSRDLLDQLPTLAQQTALILGDCITVPAQVRINDVDPKPYSHDPQFYEKWSNTESNAPDFEEICKNWESEK